MQRIIVAVLGIVVVAVIGGSIAAILSGRSAVYGLISKPSASTNVSSGARAMLALEQRALISTGLSPARAERALNVQSEVARTDLAGEVKGVLGGAFAGVWFDPAAAQLHVGTTSRTSRRLVQAAVARAGLGDDVTETTVRSTWADLVNQQKQWNRRLAGLLARRQAQTALEAQRNAVSVRLSSAVPAAERAALTRDASAAATAVDVSVEPRAQLTITPAAAPAECAEFRTKAANCNKTITAGVTIEGSERCSAGPLVVPKASKSETYVLTAGHCILQKGGIGSKWSATTKTGTKMEIGPAVEALDGTKADVGAIRVTNSAWLNTGAEPAFAGVAEWTKVASTAFQVEGENEPMVGHTSCHEGSTTGQLCGKILATNIQGPGVNGLVEVEVNEGKETLGGDSGGPWMFINTNSTALMEGTEVGEASKNAKHSAFEPLKTAVKELKGLDLELLTKGNEGGR